MPESKGRRKPPPRKKPSRRVLNPGLGTEVPLDEPEEAPRKPDRSITHERPPEDLYQEPSELPPPASEDQLLVALARLDPLAQEVMIASRLAAMPNPCEGGPPINIHRKVRPEWAHQLRRLGIFCIPELATHELIAPDASGVMVNHTGATLESIDRSDLWERAKAQNPALGKIVDNAKTPAQKKAAMRKLAARLPVEYRMALDKLIESKPEDLEPV